jgi:archaeal type IV pilus assembly protein PilA
MKFTKNDEAVSPVIGVILMVAITVILAAVIAAFVFGMAGNIQKTKVVAATASQQGSTTIYVTYQGGQDQALVQSVSATVTNAETGAVTGPSDVGTAVGGSATFNGGSQGRDHVVATAQFTDGTTQVILDTYV